MIVQENQLAKKYATAFLNVCKKNNVSIHQEIITAFSDFVTSNKHFQAILNLPSLPTEEKHKIINLVAEKIQISKTLKKLVYLLLEDKRIDLLGEVLRKIALLYKTAQKEHHFFVTTSHPLEPSEEKSVISFIEHLLQKQKLSQDRTSITTTFGVDVSLISGIKIRGNTLLWERSISKQLKQIEQKILRREELW